MKILKLFIALLFTLNFFKVAAQELTGKEFWAKHKEEILSVYLQYEELNKDWFKQVKEIPITADYTHQGGYIHYDGEGNKSGQELYMVKAKGIVKKQERNTLQEALENTNIERAWFRVGRGTEHKMVSSIVVPKKYDEPKNANILWDDDINPYGGTPYEFNGKVKGREDIFVKCLSYTEEATGIAKMQVSIYSDFGTCIFYIKQ